MEGHLSSSIPSSSVAEEHETSPMQKSIHSEHSDDSEQYIDVPHSEEDSDCMVSSFNSGSEKSLNLSGTLINPEDYTISSEDDSSVNSVHMGDTTDSYEFPEIILNDDVPIVPGPGENREQILAPLISDENSEPEDENRIFSTPILATTPEIRPPSPAISEITTHSNASEKRKRTLPPNISDILLGQNRYNNFQWEDVSSRVLVRRFIHQEILVPFFQGFSWAIGMHLYRYLRYGRKNSPISTVPPAITTSHQLSGTSYLPQIPNLTDWFEVGE
ncbi:6688_t:CDS:2 [Cetraspora pellucida]|uniref:6688_t:CDS:1 n=1 Tax=Cetraspora pellucida TaxID=1433469 RepID=A0A9N9A512_9GLOM|nr:6688_t:CDS:2 [Cetraspora pellucida]